MTPHRSPGRLAAMATLALGAAALHPAAAHAYIGPGAGLTALGTAIALILALILAIVGFVWYPMKRMSRRRKAKSDPARVARERE